MAQPSHPSSQPSQAPEQPAVPARLFVWITVAGSLIVALFMAYMLSGMAGTPLISIAVVTSTATPTATAVLTPTPRPIMVFPPTPSPTPTSTPTPQAITRWVVANTGGDGVWLRQSPDLAAHVAAWAEGAEMVIVGPDEQAQGMTWKHVRDPAGHVGYIPAQYLAPAPGQSG
ncbi:MAG: SH3 domain-containing protein [Chloroflexota bacterium]